ncbi:variable large family protein (plasmid) [Borrelia turicatae]
MTLFLLLSCGGGSAKAEDPQSRFLKSLISLSNDFLNVFTSFADMLGGVLGFNTNTKKSDIGNYFNAVSASIGAVTGADILKAIASANADATKDGKVKDATDAAALALTKGTSTANDDQLGDSAKKDAVIAAGIALRAMAKDGKFIVKDTAANKTEAEAAKGVAANAVGKTLSTLIIAIRNTVDSGLKTISAALATVTQEDKSVEATTPADTATVGQNSK